MLQEAYPHGSVTVAANGFQSATTSHGAAGLWKPFKLGEFPTMQAMRQTELNTMNNMSNF